jgi:hypothetical protein
MSIFSLPEGNWLPVPGFEGFYAVSDDGRVHSLPRTTTKGRIIRQRHDPNGYLQVTLSREGRHTTHRVHILVLTAFREPRPPGLEGAHDDGDKDNCRLENLLWKTVSANRRDILRHGRHNYGNATHCKWGHRFTRSNTRIARNGQRVCRRCDNTRRCQRAGLCSLKAHDHEGTPWKILTPY